MLKSLFSRLTRLSLKYWWITIGLAVICLAGGVFAATRLNQELLPNIEFPQTFIVAIRPGASSEDLLDLVTKPLENETLKIKGVIPAGLETTTTAPAAFLIVRNEYGVGQSDIRGALQKAIDKVNADGVPVGLKTTADLTPEIVTKVLQRAPSMFQHFEAAQLLAMKPEVLNAALAVNPDFINQIDLQTRDQLAAARVSATVTGTATDPKPAELPAAWAITDKQTPAIFPFDLNSIPVLTASIFTTTGDMNADQLRSFVNDKIVAELYQANIQGLPKDKGVTVSGGQQIPANVYDAAVAAVAKARAQTSTTNPTQAATPAPQTSTTPQTTTSTVTAPALPDSWRSILNLVLLRSTLKPVTQFDTADNLLNVTDDGTKISAADLLNKLAATDSGFLLRDLSPEAVAYLRSKEAGFTAALSDKSLEYLAAATFNASTWNGLQKQTGFSQANLSSVMDLAKLKGSVAATLNAIVTSTPKEFNTFAIRLVSSLSPEAVTYILKQEPDFIAKLDPQVLRDMSAEALQTIPSTILDALKDDKLKADLRAIIADPSKAAVASLTDTAKIPDDPNAPLLPDALTQGVKAFGVVARKADDLLKKPFNLSAGEFINQIAKSPNGADLTKQISADVFFYLQQKDPTFFNTLTSATLVTLAPDVLAKLPADVQARASSGPAFTPLTTITRTNSRESLTISVFKDTDANTVVVADGVAAVFNKVQAENPTIQIATIFEQAGFIKDSISGVAREGGLGALMAVIVILLFLNFSVRSTLVTAVSIPTSVAIALILMKYVPGAVHSFVLQPSVAAALPDVVRTFLLRLFPASITLNIMTLSGLTVAVGRVVDDSIVVLENIYRQMQKGTPPREAVIRGTRDVSAAIFAATLTTVVVFLPIGLAGGVVGEFFLPFGLAVTYSLIASFVVAVTIVPLLAYLFISPKHLPADKEGRLESGYHRLIGWALSHRWLVLGMAFVTLIFGLWLFSKRPATFLPSLGEPQISVTVSLPSGTTIAQTDVRVADMETYLNTITGPDKGVKKYQTAIGNGGGFAALFGGSSVSEQSATITVAVNAKQPDALTALTQDIRGKAEEIFGAKSVTVSKGSLSDQGFGGFALVVSGPDAELHKVNDEVIAKLSTVKGLTNVKSSLNLIPGASNAYLRINQAAAVQYSGELETQDTLGLTTQAIAAVKALPDLPADLSIGQGFQSQQQTEGFTQTFSSMGIAIIIVYLVMVFTFGSLIHPFTILFSLPLAIVGAALGLTITNRVLGISALIGLLMLIGIVVTNAIVFIDRVQANRKEREMPTREALIEGGRTRLRPILMTAVATMFALLPLAIGLSEGAIIASELGTVVIGGLFSSTLLTLLVVPVIYSMFDGAQRSLLRRPVEAPKVASGD